MDGSVWSVVAAIAPSLVTGAVALAAGPLFSFWMARSNSRKEAETLRATLVAEVSGILDLINTRDYMAGLKAGAAGLLQMGLSVDVPDSYFQVYRANLGKLGLLPPTTAEHIVYFYMLLEAVKQDVKPGGALNDPKVPFDQKVQGFVVDVELLGRAIEIGETIRGR